MNNIEIRHKFYASVVHPFIAIFVPFWFLSTMLLVFVNSAVLPTGRVVFPPFYAGLLLLVGISETVTGNMLYKERIGGMLPRLREFVFVVLLGGFFIMLLHGDILRGQIRIGKIHIWLPLVLLAVQWFMSYYIHQKLREREIFLKFFENKEAKQVKETYQSYMHEGGESLKAVNSVKKFIIVLTVMGFVMFLIMTWGFRIRYGGFPLFMIISFFAINLLLIASLNGLHDTQFIMMDGYVVSRKQRRFRFSLILLIFVVVFVLIIPFTGSRPLLPSSYLEAFFAWLQSIGQFEPPDTEVEPPEFTGQQEDYDVGSYLGEAMHGMSEQDQTLANLVRVIGLILLGVAGLGAVVFLLLPLFRSGKGALQFRETLKKGWTNIAAFLNNASTAIQRFIQSIKDRRKLRVWNKLGSKGRGSAIQDTLERAAAKLGLSRRERKAQGRALKTFFRFTRWGEKQGVPFRTTLGAWEYAVRIKDVPQDIQADCKEIAGMFEEILYSNHEIEDSFRSEFADKVKKVVKS